MTKKQMWIGAIVAVVLYLYLKRNKTDRTTVKNPNPARTDAIEPNMDELNRTMNFVINKQGVSAAAGMDDDT